MNLIPIVNLGTIYTNGPLLSKLSATELSLTGGQLRDSTNVFDITSKLGLTLDSTFTGVNGIDTGAVQPNTFYAVYVIFDPTNTNVPASLMSASLTDPIMPSANSVTYGAYRLVGYVKTDGAGEFLDFRITGNGNQRHHTWDVPVEVLAGGAATAGFASVDLALGVPSLMGSLQSTQTSLDVDLRVDFVAATGGDLVAISSGASTATVGSAALSGSVAAVSQAAQLGVVADFMPALNYELRYENSAAACAATVAVSGFTYFI